MLSLLRKLSLGSKIKDGIVLDDKMATGEDIIFDKNYNITDENELKDTVYGKNNILFNYRYCN